MTRRIDRRGLLAMTGLAAAGAGPLLTAGPATAARPTDDAGPVASGSIPADARPGGAYDRYVAGLAAAGKFSGVVMLAHRGRTVLSRAYGMADEQRGIRNRESTAFTLSSAGKPFNAIAVLQLAQQGKLTLSDKVGRHLSGIDQEIAERVTIHHLLSGMSGTNTPPEEVERVFHSRADVHDFYQRRARLATLVGVPGLPSTAHAEADVTLAALIVEAVSGLPYWDYVERNIFARCGMTGSGFFTRPQWLTDRHLAHPYMTVAGGSVVDALHHLDQGSPHDWVEGKNPGRIFVDAPGDGGFASAPDLVRFARGLTDGTLLDRAWADVFLSPKVPHGPASFGAYGTVADILGGQAAYQRAGGNPGVGANWTIYPHTGWVGVILVNRDAEGLSLQDLVAREMQAVTGVAPDGGAGG
ncbi:serine hydrolase domain-containing protein [Paractinoplanes lichenicola]|uniref:Beta-lactamase family protein n=1 Tax=Paractinoplanes lichenicola TaxID=2802976 RepID=A0ABS1VUZ7_9ACTN|nr:serine hydrolase domain-containing protein [Actinoplanes lichenicola]MBL7258288.1 beta-lactamase family protein [Actinoplanes lichenicola]